MRNKGMRGNKERIEERGRCGKRREVPRRTKNEKGREE